MQMRPHRIHLHSQRFTYLSDFHLLSEFHQEDGALVVRQRFQNTRKQLDLLLGLQLGFGAGAVAGRKEAISYTSTAVDLTFFQNLYLSVLR